MNGIPISEVVDPDIRDAYAALLRAAQRARELSIQTRVPLVVNRNGLIEYLSPWLDDEPTSQPSHTDRLMIGRSSAAAGLPATGDGATHPSWEVSAAVMATPPEDDAREPASPVCYAGAFPEYFGGTAAPDPRLIDLLNALLEAERAGAKVLAVLMQGLAADSPVAQRVAVVQKDERDNAILLYQTIKRIGGTASPRIGDFVAKTLAIDGLNPRLAFVNKGQAWVARKIDEALKLPMDADARAMLDAMKQSHLVNIDACAALIAP